MHFDAAIDVDGLSGHVLGQGQIHGQLPDIVRGLGSALGNDVLDPSVARRPSLDSSGCLSDSARYSHIWVRRIPGQMALTRILAWANSLASELLKPTTANFEAQ